MKMKFKILLIFIVVGLFIFVFNSKCEAKSYSVEDMDIQATIEKDGSVDIKQTLTYKFNGQYNGIYINVPYNSSSRNFNEVQKYNRINDLIYNGYSINVKSVKQIQDNKEIEYSLNDMAYNGMNGCYTTKIIEDGMEQIKVFSPSLNTTKKFEINYVINSLCVKHNDIGELYYNFIGGSWEVEIKNLNIDIYLPNNKDEIQIWGHGPYNGNSKIIDKTHANFRVKNVKKGEYVATRVLFENYNISSCDKISYINAKQIIYQDENAIIENKKEKNEFTNKVIIFTICLFIYWIILLLIYEKDKKQIIQDLDEDELFKKYNPMLAGCIQGSRDILARDIIAVILGLINKNNIKLQIYGKSKGKDKYTYAIKRNIKTC